MLNKTSFIDTDKVSSGGKQSKTVIKYLQLFTG